VLMKGGVIVDDGVVKYTSIYNYILSLDHEALDEELDKRIERYGYFPPINKVLKPFILKKFFPQFMGPLSSEFAGQQVSDLENITIPNVWECITKEAKLNSKEANKVTAWYLSNIFKYISQYKVTRKDGKIYHVVDYRINPDEYTQRLLKNVTTDKETLIANSASAASGFLQLLLARREPSREEFHQLAEWYLKDLCLDESTVGARSVLKALNEILELKDKDVSDLILEIYEEHVTSFNKMMARFPEYNFIIRGKSEKYRSIEDYARAHPEESEFFVEEADSEHVPSASQQKRQQKQAERSEHREKVLKSLDQLFLEVQQDGESSDIHVLNFTPNELKTNKQHSDFIGIAFRRGDKWWILVDCIKPGIAAIYLWRGERYSQGLETFKMARSYARQEPGVVRKNHVKTREFIEIYHLLMKKW